MHVLLASSLRDQSVPFFVLQRIISALQPELALLLDFLVTIPLSPSRLCCPSLYIWE